MLQGNIADKAGELAEWTGLEPATPGVTGRYSNQLNYHSALSFAKVLTKAGIIHEIRSLFPVVNKKMLREQAIMPVAGDCHLFCRNFSL